MLKFGATVIMLVSVVLSLAEPALSNEDKKTGPSVNADGNPLQLLMSARIKWEAKDRQGAVRDLDKVIEFNPQNVHALLLRAAIKGDMKDYQGSLEDVNQILKIDPEMMHALKIRAFLKTETKDYKGALEDLSGLISKNNGDSDLFAKRGIVYGLMDDSVNAGKDLQKAMQLNPSNDEALLALCANMLHEKRWKEAHPLAEKYIAKHPKVGIAYFYRGRASSGLEQPEEALKDYSRGIELQPENYRAYSSRGFIKLVLRDFKGSLADSDVAIERNPKNYIPYGNKAVVWFIEKNYNNAADSFQKAASLCEDKDRKIRAQILYSFNLRLDGKVTEAGKELKQVKKLAEKSNLKTIVSYLDGDANEEQVMSVSKERSYNTIVRALMGLDLLYKRKTDAARRHLNWVKQNGDKSEDEYYLAREFSDCQVPPCH